MISPPLTNLCFAGEALTNKLTAIADSRQLLTLALLCFPGNQRLKAILKPLFTDFT